MKKYILYVGTTIVCLAVLAGGLFAQNEIQWEGVLPDIFTGTSGTEAINIAWVQSTVGLDVSEETALTNTVHPIMDLTHQTSGTAAAGIGLEIRASQEIVADEIIGSIGFVVDDATAASEDASFSVELMTAGAAKAEVFAIESTGVLTLVNAETISNAVNGTVAINGIVDVTAAGGVVLSNDEAITNAVNGSVDIASATALTNSTSPILTLTHTTSGTPAANLGSEIQVIVETSADNNEIIGAIGVIAADDTAATEDGDLVVRLMKDGATATEAFRVTSTGVVTLVNAATIDNSTNGTVVVTEPTISLQGALDYAVCTIADGDETPDVTGCRVLETSANTGATEITDLDNPVVGAMYTIVGTSATNSSTITDGGSFALSAGFTASVDEVITLYVQADNDYIEVSRATN
jgi:hypothetical protein